MSSDYCTLFFDLGGRGLVGMALLGMLWICNERCGW